jgi:hypothetical protein
MAVENRGGFRPTAPQNNPMSVSPMGGNGQSGSSAAKKTAKAQQLRMSGLPTGENRALSQQIVAGGGVKTTAPAVASAGMPRTSAISLGRGAPVTPITAPTALPEEPIQAGTTLPGGPGPEALTLPPQPEGDKMFNSSIQAYAQPLEYIVSLPTTSQETRDVIALLLRQTAQ